MDIWERLYLKAKDLYNPKNISPFVYGHNVVCALESENGEIFTGICIESCSGVLNLCAERTAALNMYMNSGQTAIKRIIAFRDKAPMKGLDCIPCGACIEFLLQLDIKNKNAEYLIDFDNRETMTLEQLMPNWWGYQRCK